MLAGEDVQVADVKCGCIGKRVICRLFLLTPHALVAVGIAAFGAYLFVRARYPERT